MTNAAVSQLPTGAPVTLKASREGSAFGNVLSAKMSGPVADSQDSLSPARPANATAPGKTSSKNLGGVKLGDEKRIAEDHVPATTAITAEILPSQSFVTTGQGNPHPSKAGLGGAPCDPSESSLGSGAALNATAPQPPISIVPAFGALTQEAIGSTSPADKQDATAAADQQDTTSGPAGDETPSSVSPFAGVTAFAQDLQTGPGVAAETASLESVVPPKGVSSGTLRPEATQQDLEHSSAGGATPASGDPVVAASGSTDPANATHVAVSAADVLAKLQETTSRTAGAAVQDTIAEFNRNSEGESQVREIPTQAKEASVGHPLPYAQPPNPITSTQPEMPAPQVSLGDALARKTIDLMQPVRPSTIRDEQQNTDTPSSVALPTAAHPAATGFSTRGDRSQIVPDAAASSPAENAQPSPTVLQSVQVLERMGKSEIRLGLNSSNFGSIELRTSVNQDRVGASIATSHAELRTAMIAEMPSLERAIAQHQMSLDSLQLDSRSGTQAGDNSPSGGNQSGSRTGAQSASKTSELGDDSAAQEVSLPQAWMAPHSGLNVHA